MNSNNKNPFQESEIITILVVSDIAKSKTFYLDVLGASLYREYGGNSVVLKFLNNWILLVTPGGPTEDKPKTYFTPPVDKNSVSHSFTIRVKDCEKSYEILKEKGPNLLHHHVIGEQKQGAFLTIPMVIYLRSANTGR